MRWPESSSPEGSSAAAGPDQEDPVVAEARAFIDSMEPRPHNYEQLLVNEIAFRRLSPSFPEGDYMLINDGQFICTSSDPRPLYVKARVLDKAFIARIGGNIPIEITSFSVYPDSLLATRRAPRRRWTSSRAASATTSSANCSCCCAKPAKKMWV
eukprot:TRINITY_DN3966_c0_g2_i3.p1 TRINITY_DN3966_c0_g2~~TRINITY_DN3966_c0_g2_i3.p1  ORF type:complete len:155 (+),score=31.47 TRINITY_DN3966_c0_g2_i3:138-602(+)